MRPGGHVLPFCLWVGASSALPGSTPADPGAELDSALAAIGREHRVGMREAREELNRYVHDTEADFSRWYRHQQRDLNEFRRRVSHAWGTFREPSGKLWVEYGRDSASVSVVDFETGTVTVEVLVSSGKSVAEMRRAIESAVARTIRSTGNPGLVPMEPIGGAERLGRSILSDQVRGADGALVDSSNVGRFVDSLLADPATMERERVRGGSREKVRMRFHLVPDHVKRRMSPYLPIVQKYCERYGLLVSRVLATIHTESCFNPMARSERNAIGLMQLVPHTGGREAYRSVYGKDVIPTAAYLCDPESNIELGCAYIHLLKHRYFGAVKDSGSLLYCSIAAYNTGPGNVAYAFTGRKAMRAATRAINTMKDAESVYNHMIRSLPFAETRYYLAIVIERMGMYGRW